MEKTLYVSKGRTYCDWCPFTGLVDGNVEGCRSYIKTLIGIDCKEYDLSTLQKTKKVNNDDSFNLACEHFERKDSCMTLKELQQYCTENGFNGGNSVEYLIANLFRDKKIDSTIIKNLIQEQGINWEQRRFELVKAAIQGYCANSAYVNEEFEEEVDLAGYAVLQADAVLAEYR